MKRTITFLGGKKEKTYPEIGKRLGVEVFFFKPFKKNSIRNQLMKMIKTADSVVIIGGGCCHKGKENSKIV